MHPLIRFFDRFKFYLKHFIFANNNTEKIKMLKSGKVSQTYIYNLSL